MSEGLHCTKGKSWQVVPIKEKIWETARENCNWEPEKQVLVPFQYSASSNEEGYFYFWWPQRAIAQIPQHKNALLIFFYVVLSWCCLMSHLHPMAGIAESCFICSNLKTRFSSFSTFWLWKWFSIHYQGCDWWLKWVRFIHLLLSISHAAYLKYFCPVLASLSLAHSVLSFCMWIVNF